MLFTHKRLDLAEHVNQMIALKTYKYKNGI